MAAGGDIRRVDARGGTAAPAGRQGHGGAERDSVHEERDGPGGRGPADPRGGHYRGEGLGLAVGRAGDQGRQVDGRGALVDVANRDVGRVETAVGRVGARRGRRDDCVGDVAVDLGVRDARDGDGLGVLQFAAVNVTEAGLAVPSEALLEDSPMVTVAVGWLFRTTVNVAVPPDSVVTSPDVGVTLMPGVSLSRFVTDTSGTMMRSYRLSSLRVGEVMIE